MINRSEKMPKPKQVQAKKVEEIRKPYHKPRLEALGRLHTLTLGVSPGLNDSLAPFLRRL